MADILICKNDRCGRVVPPSRNPGRPRLFCSTMCARRYHARMAYQRERGTRGDGMLYVNDYGHAQIHRQLPTGASLAKKRLVEHNQNCAVSKTGGLCPAYYDVYDKKRLCLIHAVFNEDWSQMMAAEDGLPFKRTVTTEDGRWMEDDEKERRLLAAGYGLPQENGAPPTIEEKLTEFVEAGGATQQRPEEFYGRGPL